MTFNGYVVVVGASAGGIEALSAFFRSTPADLPAAFLVVQHLSPNYRSSLPEILSRQTSMRVERAMDGEKIKAHRVYVAPADHHLLIEGDTLLVKRGPKENRFRPSVDALFRSAAYSYGPRVIGVVLSGALDDGTSGLWTIKRRNGTTMIQDPAEAEFDSMPASALEQVEIDHCLKVEDMGALLKKLIARPIRKEKVISGEDDQLRMEISIAAEGDAFKKGVMTIGKLTPYTCPECHGVLVEITDGKLKRYRCHTGHGYSSSALLSEIVEKVEQSYWSAMRSLEEAAMLLKNWGDDLSTTGDKQAAKLFFSQAKIAEEQSRQLKDTLLSDKRFDAEQLFNR